MNLDVDHLNQPFVRLGILSGTLHAPNSPDRRAPLNADSHTGGPFGYRVSPSHEAARSSRPLGASFAFAANFPVIT